MTENELAQAAFLVAMQATKTKVMAQAVMWAMVPHPFFQMMAWASLMELRFGRERGFW